MKIFGAISAVYLGLYLVLPGCLCQLLNCFGVVPVDSSLRSEELCALFDNAEDTICHCHEAVSKTAEATHSAGNITEPVNEFSALLVTADAELSSPPLAGTGSGRAPPSANLPAMTSLRSFTGVYLI